MLLYCPLCTGNLEGVDTERFKREQKPDAVRCKECGKGWEIISFNGKLLMSEAPSFDKPKLKVTTCTSAK